MCLQSVNFFFIRQYVQSCLSKNPKYTFYTIKSLLTLTYLILPSGDRELRNINLEYATAVWSPYKQHDIDNIENVQRRVTKQIPSLKDMEYPDRLKKLKISTLKYRRLRGDMIETFKIITGIYDNEVTAGIIDLELGAIVRKSRRNSAK